MFNLKMANRLPWLTMNQLFWTEVTEKHTGADPLSGT